MQFTVPDGSPLPFAELLVDLTEGRNRLTLTGGFFGVAAGGDEPHTVAFNVRGGAIPPIPEPAGGILFVLAALVAAACRMGFNRR